VSATSSRSGEDIGRTPDAPISGGAMIDPHLQDTIDYTAVVRLQRAYADVVNRRSWSELSGLFVPDIQVELDLVTSEPRHLVGPGAVGTFISDAIERFSFFEFVMLNNHIELGVDADPNRASARIFMCELRQNVGEAERNDAFGLYQDDYVRIDDRWWFAARRYRSMGRFPPGVVFALPDDLPSIRF
jgi:hypothetical protein